MTERAKQDERGTPGRMSQERIDPNPVGITATNREGKKVGVEHASGIGCQGGDPRGKRGGVTGFQENRQKVPLLKQADTVRGKCQEEEPALG